MAMRHTTEKSPSATNPSPSLTLEDKARLSVGLDYWHTADLSEKGIPSIMMTDGPNGVRKQDGDSDLMGLNVSVPAVCYPTASAMAASFDTELIYRVAADIGAECRKAGSSLLLGPGVNIKRHPYCGRSFEYFSEDPVVSGEMGAAFVNGVQSQGVGSCVKHFAANNQELFRMLNDSIVDDRALHELYLRPFERIVKKSQPWAVMSSYNKINGIFANEDKGLLTDLLRTQWGFDGMIVTDWGGMNDQVAATKAGCNLEMPGGDSKRASTLVRAVESGLLPEATLDFSAARVADFVGRAVSGQKKPYACDMDAHLKTAQEAAEASAVLLKNNGILPLHKHQHIALIGEFSKTPRYQGAGSSKINPIKLDSIFEAFGDAGLAFEYAQGYKADDIQPDTDLIEQAVEAAKQAEAAVIVVGLPDICESEGFDRDTYAMPDSHTKLIEQVSMVNPNTVVVLQCGCPVEVSWEDYASAILLTYLGGCMGGHAAVRLLLGEANPSGKLAESWPYHINDCYVTPIYPSHPQAIYKESIFVGYRYYEKAMKAVRYPFGYGLSYTSFDYSDISVTQTPDEITVACKITNTGATAGAEVVQCYVGKPDSQMTRPVKELKGFHKVFLMPGESKVVSIAIEKELLTVFSQSKQHFLLENGTYIIMLASSCRDVRLSCEIEIAGETLGKDERNTYLEELPASILDISDEMYEAVYGKEIPAPHNEKYPYTLNATLTDLEKTAFGKLLGIAVDKFVRPGFGTSPVSLKMFENVKVQTPLRGLSIAGFKFSQIEAILNLCNGKVFKGLQKLIKG